jgi:hypothetical protein
MACRPMPAVPDLTHDVREFAQDFLARYDRWVNTFVPVPGYD